MAGADEEERMTYQERDLFIAIVACALSGDDMWPSFRKPSLSIAMMITTTNVLGMCALVSHNAADRFNLDASICNAFSTALECSFPGY